MIYAKTHKLEKYKYEINISTTKKRNICIYVILKYENSKSNY